MSKKIWGTNNILKMLKAYKIKKYLFPARPKITDQEIKFILESIPEQKLIRIERNKLGRAKAFYLAPDNNARLKALDKAYKLKGKYRHPLN